MAKNKQISGIEWIKYDWKAFKLNKTIYLPKLTISEGGFVAKHYGSDGKK